MNPANDVALNISLNSTSIGEVLTKNRLKGNQSYSNVKNLNTLRIM